jgi:hypothetical protein
MLVLICTIKLVVMKKNIAIVLILGLLLPAIPMNAQDGMKKKNKTETAAKRKSNIKKDENQAVVTSAGDKHADELRKREIEKKEQSVDKNKKVKRLTLDENLPATIRNRNIP